MSLGPDLRTETRFRLLRELARGGMATVYEAEQLGAAGFSKRMAVKIIHDRFAEHPEWLQLFIDEAKLSANLVHGNIVQIYFFGNSDRGPFIAMELIKGITLRTLINTHRKRKEPLPPDSPLYRTPNVVITPHTSWASNRVIERSVELFVDNLRRDAAGEPLRNVVDLDAGY